MGWKARRAHPQGQEPHDLSPGKGREGSPLASSACPGGRPPCSRPPLCCFRDPYRLIRARADAQHPTSPPAAHACSRATQPPSPCILRSTALSRGLEDVPGARGLSLPRALKPPRGCGEACTQWHHLPCLPLRAWAHRGWRPHPPPPPPPPAPPPPPPPAPPRPRPQPRLSHQPQRSNEGDHWGYAQGCLVLLCTLRAWHWVACHLVMPFHSPSYLGSIQARSSPGLGYAQGRQLSACAWQKRPFPSLDWPLQKRPFPPGLALEDALLGSER